MSDEGKSDAPKAHAPSQKQPAKPSFWNRAANSLFKKGVAVSDWAGGYVNAWTEACGAERFWPHTNDFPQEVEKCTRILRNFTSEGVPVPEHVGVGKNKRSLKAKVVKKIPPQVLRDAKGIVIYSCMKTGLAPLGGMNGIGLVLGRLPDGSWSAPSALAPGNTSAGFLIGLDFMDVILIINSEDVLNSFKTHKFSLSAETNVTTGPLGAGVASGVDIKKEPAPIYQYVQSRGFYAGLELAGSVFFDRFDENERVYYWPGIKAKDILEGRARAPVSAEPLLRALREAELGISQGGLLETPLEKAIPAGPDAESIANESEILHDGEQLRLPPTPEQLEAMEHAGIKDELDEEYERREREEVRRLPPPPKHPDVAQYWVRNQTSPALNSAPPISHKNNSSSENQTKGKEAHEKEQEKEKDDGNEPNNDDVE